MMIIVFLYNLLELYIYDLKQDKKIYLYIISESSGVLQEIKTIDNVVEVSDMMFFFDGQYLVIVGVDRYVRCFKLFDYEVSKISDYMYRNE